MKTENQFQRFVEDVRVAARRLYFTVIDSTGKETEVQYNIDRKEWLCTCKGSYYTKNCGHVEECKKYCTKTKQFTGVIE